MATKKRRSRLKKTARASRKATNEKTADDRIAWGTSERLVEKGLMSREARDSAIKAGMIRPNPREKDLGEAQGVYEDLLAARDVANASEAAIVLGYRFSVAVHTVEPGTYQGELPLEEDDEDGDEF